MRHLKKHIERVSLEDAENSTADLTPKDPVIENVESEPEEIEQLEADLLVDPEPAGDSVRAEIEEMEDLSVAVEEFQAILRGAATRGGMRAEEGAIVGTALRHFHKRLGIGDKETLSQEDFGGTMSRLKATQVSQEAFGEVAKAAGAKIKELVLRLIAFLKEKAAAFDAQGLKVKQILSQIKPRLKTIITGEIELEYEGNRIGERDILNPKTLSNAVSWAVGLNQHMATHLKATADKVYELARSQGTAEDVTAFEQSIEGMWGSNTNPIASVMRVAQAVGYPLTQSYRAIMTHKDNQAGTVVLAYSLELKGTTPAPVKMSLNKGQFTSLVDATDKMNDLVQAMTLSYANNASVINRLCRNLDIKTPEANAAADKVVMALITMLEHDIYEVVKCISAARAELGYICAVSAKKFGL